MSEKVEFEITEAKEATETTAKDYVVKFSKPYFFEGKTYNEVNLSGLEDITTNDMMNAEGWLVKKGIVSATPEMTMSYSVYIASIAARLPVEFFENLQPQNAIKVKNKITNFFYGEG